MDFSDLLDQINITLGDTADTTFTTEEKQRALTKAFNDPYVINDVWDTTGSFDVSNYQEPVPTNLTTVRDIGVKVSSTDFPQPISSDFYDIVGTNIHWTQGARYGLTDGTTIYVYGTKKLTTSDTLSTVALQEYVTALASLETLTLLGFKKANLFLKNDTTMGELIALKRDLQKDVDRMRARFRVNVQSV